MHEIDKAPCILVEVVEWRLDSSPDEVVGNIPLGFIRQEVTQVLEKLRLSHYDLFIPINLQLLQ